MLMGSALVQQALFPEAIFALLLSGHAMAPPAAVR
jgi:hypothetical protein